MAETLRYAVFAGDTYYPGGGWQDHVITLATVEEARAALAALRAHKDCDWGHIVDLLTGKILEGAGND